MELSGVIYVRGHFTAVLCSSRSPHLPSTDFSPGRHLRSNRIPKLSRQRVKCLSFKVKRGEDRTFPISSCLPPEVSTFGFSSFERPVAGAKATFSVPIL